MSTWKLLLLCVLAVLALGLAGCGDCEERTACAADDAGQPDAAPSILPDAGQPGPDASQPVLPERVAKLGAALDTAMFDCPERVWPGLSYRDRQILLVDSTAETAWLWNDQELPFAERPGITPVTYSELGPEWTSFFGLGKFHTAETVSISLDLTQGFMDMLEQAGMPMYEDMALLLAVHESFHIFGPQVDWTVPDGARATPYPMIARPRYLRNRVIASLMSEVASGNGAGLAAAAYWHDTWTTEFPAEHEGVAPTDMLEGSASFAEVLSIALTRVGCGATTEVLLDQAESLAPEQIGMPLAVNSAADTESYAIGLLSGLLLRRAGTPGWEYSVAGTSPPVEILLADVTPLAQADDAAALAEADIVVADHNAMIATNVDPAAARLQDSEAYLIAMNPAWQTGSYSVSGFALMTALPATPIAFVEFEGTLSPSAGNLIEITGEPLFEYAPPVAIDNPCPGFLATDPLLVVTLPKSEVAAGSTNGTFTASGGKVVFTDLSATLATASDSRSWLCPTP